MSPRPVVLRERAQRDVDDALDHYRDEASAEAALHFIDALEEAFLHLSDYPASGSSRYARELDLPGVRSWNVTGSPFLIFYVEREGNVDVWRVLHAARDVPAWLQEPED